MLKNFYSLKNNNGQISTMTMMCKHSFGRVVKIQKIDEWPLTKQQSTFYGLNKSSGWFPEPAGAYIISTNLS